MYHDFKSAKAMATRYKSRPASRRERSSRPGKAKRQHSPRLSTTRPRTA